LNVSNPAKLDTSIISQYNIRQNHLIQIFLK